MLSACVIADYCLDEVSSLYLTCLKNEILFTLVPCRLSLFGYFKRRKKDENYIQTRVSKSLSIFKELQICSAR